MHVPRIKAIFLAAAVGSVTGAAQAATPVFDVSGTVSGLNYQLVDLDTNDGITPWIQFNPTGILAMVAGQLDENFFPKDGFIILPGKGISATSGTKSSTDGLAFASNDDSQRLVTVKAFADNFQNGNAFSIQAGMGYFYGSGINDESGLPLSQPNEFSFTLSANTALVIEATADMSVKLNSSLLQGTNFEQSLIDQKNYALLTAEVYTEFNVSVDQYDPVSDAMMTVGDGAYLNAFQQLSLVSGQAWLDVQDSQTQFLQARVENASAIEVSGLFSFFQIATIDTAIFASQISEPSPDPWTPPIDSGPIDPTPAVPEPSTYALMALGLVGIGAVARRSRPATLA